MTYSLSGGQLNYGVVMMDGIRNFSGGLENIGRLLMG